MNSEKAGNILGYILGGCLWGIYLGGNNLADQNTAYLNNQSGGIYGNMNVSVVNTYGTNHAP